jgi:hypothetical protein
MQLLSRRSTMLAACGSVVSTAYAGAWLVREWVHDTVPGRGRKQRTRFGTVAVLAARREPARHTQQAGHSEAAHAIWSHRVIALVELRNDSSRPVLVSPGQFRLRLGASGPTVSYYGSEPSGGQLEQGRTMQMRISFLTPGEAGAVALEYTEAGAKGALTTPLDLRASTAAQS